MVLNKEYHRPIYSDENFYYQKDYSVRKLMKRFPAKT